MVSSARWFPFPHPDVSEQLTMPIRSDLYWSGRIGFVRTDRLLNLFADRATMPGQVQQTLGAAFQIPLTDVFPVSRFAAGEGAERIDQSRLHRCAVLSYSGVDTGSRINSCGSIERLRDLPLA